MIEFKAGKCPKCGRLADAIIFSNNPIAPGLCLDCLNREIDYKNLEQADFFCRTYNIPFDPQRWIELSEKVGKQTIKIYTQQFFETDSQNLWHQRFTPDHWRKLNDEWAKCRTFDELLSKIEPVKRSFMERSAIKWGGTYSFEEYVQLESLLNATLQANDITNPLQIDAIKKACRISVELDKAINAGDSKGIKELSTAYSSFTKTAQIDNVIAAANSDVITTVADLADFIEKCGGTYKFYDNVERDVVDKTINDIKEYLRVLVSDSTGLGATLETITDAYKQRLENQTVEKATSEISIQDIIADQRQAANDAFDDELAQETLEDIDMGGDDDEYFG